ncbi:hypothetical protein BH10ACT3_BH10ACT3_14450 [soil metagenome]
MIRMLTRLTVTLVVVCGAGAILAPTAGADGVRPSNFESVIDSVEPSPPGVQVDVVGGASFFPVTAAPGTKVEIQGYDGEPYLRIDADGKVQENRRSAAAYLNVRRNGDVSRMPADVSSDATPEWTTIATDGRVAWHDHRIHWMAAEPPKIPAGGVVQEWIVPMTVDSTAVVVSGRLLHHQNVFPWAAILMVAVAVASWWVSRRHRLRAPLLLAASLVAFGLAIAVHVRNPPGAQASPLPMILPVVAAVAALAALAVPKLPSMVRDLVLPLLSVAALAGWAITRVGVWWMPMDPIAVPGWLDRIGTAAVVGVILGVTVAILLRPTPDAAPSSRSSPPPVIDGDVAPT